jgi:hypothetical protein
MEVDPIAAEIESTVQDAQYNAAWAITKFNEAMNAIALVCRIPGLQASAPLTLGVGTSSIAMPKTYLRELYMVTTPTYPQGILIAPNLKEFRANTVAEAEGPIEMCVAENKIFYYNPKPLEEEIATLYFYGSPKELAAGDSFPDYIPPFLQKELFLNYALKEAYLKIEDGIDGVMFNTQKYAGLSNAAIEMLKAFYPEAPKAKPAIARGGGYY